MSVVSLRVTAADLVAIGRIVERYLAMARRLGIERQLPSALTIRMDLCAVQANGCPLDLAALAEAEEFDLAHDVGGIGRHIDRHSGQLEGHFTPRYALRKGGEA